METYLGLSVADKIVISVSAIIGIVIVVVALYFIIKKVLQIPNIALKFKGVEVSTSKKGKEKVEDVLSNNILKELYNEIEKLKQEIEALRKQDEEFNKIVKEQNKTYNFKEHSLFSNLKRRINTGIYIDRRLLKDDNFYKCKLILLNESIKCRNKLVLRFAEELVDDIMQAESDNEKSKIIHNVTKYYDRFDKESIQGFNKLVIKFCDGQIIQGLPKIFKDKFMEWDRSHTDAFYSRLNGIFNSPIYTTWNLKLMSILDNLDLITQLSRREAYHLINGFNGEIKEELIKLGVVEIDD